MTEDEKERERIRKRRDEIGPGDLLRRMTLYDQAQSICYTLVTDPNVREADPLLKLAEELRERIRLWTWGE
jgi:hypothetical protein